MKKIYNSCAVFKRFSFARTNSLLQCNTILLLQLYINRFILFLALNYALLNLTLNSISRILILFKHYKNVMNLLSFCNYHLSIKLNKNQKRELLNVSFRAFT